MEENEAVQKTNFLTMGGVSLPPILIILLTLFVSYIIYPHEQPKTHKQSTPTGKQTKEKVSSAKASPTLVKHNIDTYTYADTTPPPVSPYSTQEVPSPQAVVSVDTNTSSVNSAPPTPTPLVNTLSQNDTASTPPTPLPDITNTIIPSTITPVENDNKSANDTSGDNGNGNVTTIIPNALSLLTSNTQGLIK
jgi:hypothetical protein